ncbi:MAG: hypothetical protein ACJ72Z_01970 [Pyrinomonadaceae bacterium]
MSAAFNGVRQMAVQIALREMNQGVQEVGAENRGPRVDVYERVSNVGVNRDPAVAGRDWCGMFIYYCYREAARAFNMRLPFLADQDLWSGEKVERWTRHHPDCLVTSGSVEPGDIYVAPSYHIGMAVESSSLGGTFRSIDGNQSTGNSGQSAITLNTRMIVPCRVIVRI